MMAPERRYGVVVAGGGVAGIAAALSCARRGVRTLLVERGRVLGGTAVHAMLHHVCGLYRNDGLVPGLPLNGGIAGEVAGGLAKSDRHSRPVRLGRAFVLPFRGRNLAQVFCSLCSSEGNLTVKLSSEVSSVSRRGRHITGVTVRACGRTVRYHPQAVVDCTGSGEVGAMAGASFVSCRGRDEQLAGFTVRVRGIRGGDWMLAVRVPYHLARLVRAGLVPAPFRFTTFISGDRAGEGFLKFSVRNADAGRMQMIRCAALASVRYLGKHIPAMANAVIAEYSGMVFERKSRTIRGRRVLAACDVLRGERFPEGGVKASWPIEIWDPVRGPVYRYVGGNGYYRIPPACLEARGFSNLFMAGRCLSATAEALGSARVIGTCLATGEMAGRLAARQLLRLAALKARQTLRLAARACGR